MNNTVRITSGIYRGRVISTPGKKTHPMGNRERLALFNMISDYLPGARVLDAYAGSGALGIEAISRGAERVVFVEKFHDAAKCISKNLKTLSIDSGEVLSKKVEEFDTGENFNVILADPPYDEYEPDGATHLVQFLNNNGIFVLSHPGEAPKIDGLSLKTSKKYSGATISVYVKE